MKTIKIIMKNGDLHSPRGSYIKRKVPTYNKEDEELDEDWDGEGEELDEDSKEWRPTFSKGKL